ncbi:MAG: hypothetical protein ACF8PN_15295 [Phycisphaerales bacterium]
MFSPSSILGPNWPIVVGVAVTAFTMILFTLARRVQIVTHVHDLRVDTHRLRLNLKTEAARRRLAEYRHRQLMHLRRLEAIDPNADAPLNSPLDDDVIEVFEVSDERAHSRRAAA